MLKEYKNKTNIGVGLGLVGQVGGQMLLSENLIFGFLLMIIGIILFIWGCCSYAKGKGYNSALGLLGLISVVGLIILAILPDKNKEEKQEKLNQ